MEYITEDESKSLLEVELSIGGGRSCLITPSLCIVVLQLIFVNN